VDAALVAYSASFRSSPHFAAPTVMVAVSVICADFVAEARRLAQSSALSILQLRTGRLGLLPSPEQAEAYHFSPVERALVEQVMSTHLIGDPDTVSQGLRRLQQRTAADELMVSTRLHFFETRVRSLTLLATTWQALGEDPKPLSSPG
jgi:alkanesulfonate monooxygenase SsuD/methylene tetrahydromethanopterin reductase-like flavin-dependent oxidoreductase (luciferase family)